MEGYLETVLRGIKQGCQGTDLQVGLILSLRRDSSAALAEETVNLALRYRERGVVGLDLSGDSTQGDGSGVFAALVRGRESGLPLTLHIGESPKETAEQQMLELTLLQPSRLGHAVYLCEEGISWIQANKTPVELCLTSAIKTGMIYQAHEHPALHWLQKGHPVAICTDDPLIFNTTLSQEYARVAEAAGLLPEELQENQAALQIYNFIPFAL